MRARFGFFLAMLMAILGCGEPQPNEPYLATGSAIHAITGGSAIAINPSDKGVFDNGTYTSDGHLLWQGASGKKGGTDFTAKNKGPIGGFTRVNNPENTNGLNGECVSLVRALAERPMPHTGSWRKGLNVVASGNIAIGTAMATFSGSTYSGHTAFFNGYVRDAKGKITHIGFMDSNSAGCSTSGGVLICDHLVRRHTFPVTGKGGTTDASSYYVVLIP